MAIVKVIEVIAQSDQSWEDAVQQALAETKKTIRNIQSIYVKEFQAIVNDQQQISVYRANCKVSFVIEDAARE
jgi:flavin-binding protein dodecin